MKRDLDYVRQLLLEMEAQEETFVWELLLSTGAKERHHFQIMADAGLLIELAESRYRVSWQGYDYLDAVRDDEIWRMTKEGVSKVGGVTFGLIKKIAVRYLEDRISEKLGIQL